MTAAPFSALMYARLLSGKKSGRPRPWPGSKRRDELRRQRIDHRDLVVRLGGDVYHFSIRPQVHAFRFVADGNRAHDPAIAHVDDARLARVFVGDEQPSAIQAHRQLFGIGAAGEDALQPAAADVDDADAVGLPIRRRQLAFVRSWRRHRRPAQRDVERRSIRAELDSAWALSQRYRRDELSARRVDHAQVAGVLVGDEQSAGGSRDCGLSRRDRRGLARAGRQWQPTSPVQSKHASWQRILPESHRVGRHFVDYVADRNKSGAISFR